MESKDEIRRRVFSLRDSMPMEEIRQKSAVIFKRVADLRQYHDAKVVLAYMDFKNEVMTVEFIKKCLSEGKRVALPKVDLPKGTKADDNGRLTDNAEAAAKFKRVLTFYEINDVDRDTLPGYKGIIEPDSPALKEMDPAAVDLAVIPGVAFDLGKNRIGYGAGYYDRFLHKLRGDCLKVGVAFGLQLFDSIPAGKDDVPVDMVVTEKMLIE